MTGTLYERYRDALRGGHFAALKGHRQIAVRAYLEAAALLPDRAAPYLGLGRVELDAGRAAEALAAFEAAVERAPGEAPALDGCARALVALGRRADAATVLDRLAITHLEAEREADALAAIERALELAESRWRRRALERLRPSRPDEPDAGDAWLAELPAKERGPAPSHDATPALVPSDAAARTHPDVDLNRLAERAEEAVATGDVEELLRCAAGLARADRIRAAIDACMDALSLAPGEPAVQRALAGIYRRMGWEAASRRKLVLVERYLAAIDDPVELDRLADETEASGDIDGLLAVVERHARRDRSAAALEVAFRALALAPADARIHLAIARIHLALGWRRRAVDSVARLWRLVELTGDTVGRERVTTFVADELSRRGRVHPFA